MSRIKIKNICIILLCAFAINACKKNNDKNTVPDVTKPKISVTTPVKFSSLNSEAPVHIIGNVTDNLLNSMHIKVYTISDSNLIFEAKPNIKAKRGYTFNENYVANTQKTVVPCMLTIMAKDEANNISYDTTYFVAN